MDTMVVVVGIETDTVVVNEGKDTVVGIEDCVIVTVGETGFCEGGEEL